jgi:hypothetical protein
MTGFEAEVKYHSIVKEMDKLIAELEDHQKEISIREKQVRRIKSELKALAAEKNEVMNYKLPADYLR